MEQQGKSPKDLIYIKREQIEKDRNGELKIVQDSRVNREGDYYYHVFLPSKENRSFHFDKDRSTGFDKDSCSKIRLYMPIERCCTVEGNPNVFEVSLDLEADWQVTFDNFIPGKGWTAYEKEVVYSDDMVKIFPTEIENLEVGGMTISKKEKLKRQEMKEMLLKKGLENYQEKQAQTTLIEEEMPKEESKPKKIGFFQNVKKWVSQFIFKKSHEEASLQNKDNEKAIGINGEPTSLDMQVETNGSKTLNRLKNLKENKVTKEMNVSKEKQVASRQKSRGLDR